jgi:protein-glutamine gamma-glutamyltransferase
MLMRFSLLTMILGFWSIPGPFVASQETQRPALQTKDIEALLRTDWFGIYLQGKKIGYFRSDYDRNGDFFRESANFHMKLASFGQKSEMIIKETASFENKPPYRLMRAEMDQRNDPTPPENFLLVRKDKGFDFTYRTGKETTKKQIADLDYTLADSLAADLWIRSGPKVGDKATFKQLDVKEAKLETQTCTVLSIKNSLVGGVNVRYYEVENENSKDHLKFLTRHDDQGRTLSSVIAIFEMRLETEEQAKNTEYSQDLFVLGMVKSDRALGQTKNVRELVLRIDGKEGEIFEDGPRQSVAPGPDGSRLLKLGKKYGKESKPTEKEIADSLQETNAYNISHPKVKALAAQAVGDAKTPEEKVKRILDFVNKFIQPSLRASMPTIHDLMDKKEGDCKSYALLVVNLARANGIPAREVSGLLYVGDDQKAFGGHAWNEVVLGGVWVPVDATLRETEVDATHVCFGTESKAAKNLLNTLGKLKFKVVEVKTAP